MIKLYSVVLMIACSANASTLITESFEQMASGSVDGQNGWVVESGVGEVQTSEVFAGTQSLKVQDGSASHSLANNGNAIWTRFQAFLTGAPEVNPTITDGNTSVAFYINTNLTLTVFSNTVPVELDVPVPTNVWTHFDVYSDYESMTWNLSMNGNTVASGLPLSSDNAVIEQVQISNSSAEPVYVDDIDIRNAELTALAPDFDRDGLPDWWEQKYFSSVTGGVASAESGNPGYTYLETYTAGISPVSAEPFVLNQAGPHSLEWDAKPSRTYDVLWTTNLLSGFKPIASNLFSQSEFTDTTSNTNLLAGFYRLQVQVNDVP